uniref:Ribosomal protein L27 n=1 Tax=Pterosiphonia complanata TaxID=884089 RepID=UPI0022FD95B7|nr:Ribosomal protein L27 [Pterosiphonia complanata]WAX03024.1 Ribosomal protein L27 [Pterosiphonia complanata]
MAHKKGSGSTKNGRDSNSKKLGVKKYGGEIVKPGQIIVRQRGSKFKLGTNVNQGKDYTIYSIVNGVVQFEVYKKNKRRISVDPS